MKSILLLLAGAALGALVLMFMPDLRELLPSEHGHENSNEHAKQADTEVHDESALKLSNEQLRVAGIKLTDVQGGELRRHFLVPGAVVPSADRIARISVRLLGTVAELRKRLGDTVAKGEVVAVIESREVADAKSEYLAALSANSLEQTMLDRSQSLYESKATSENTFLRTRATAEQAKIKLDAARQKLAALGLVSAQIAALPQQPVEALRRQELHSPIAGRVAQRRVDIGSLVGREGQESELFVIVDLDEVWVELAVAPADLPKILEGQEITIMAGSHASGGHAAQAKIVFVSPLLDADTRNARVVASLDNSSREWRPGSYVTAEIPVGSEMAKVLLPKTALQSIRGQQTVFVRRGEEFEPRAVQAGREDDDAVEILSGLVVGETVAVTNTFTLKAELGKSEAEHAH